MNNRDAINLHKVLMQLNQVPGKPQFVYALVYNRNKIKEVVEAVTAAQMFEPESPAEAFQNRRAKLIDKYARRNTQGSPVTNGTHIVLDDAVGFQTANQKLEIEHAKEFEAWKSHQANIAEVLDAEFDVAQLRKMHFSTLPATITPELLDAIWPVLVGEPPEITEDEPKPAPVKRVKPKPTPAPPAAK